MKEKLIEIGRDTAMLWGAECVDYKIDKKEKQVTFDCIEHGERFYTSLSFEELAKDHNIKEEDLINEFNNKDYEDPELERN